VDQKKAKKNGEKRIYTIRETRGNRKKREKEVRRVEEGKNCLWVKPTGGEVLFIRERTRKGRRGRK